MKWILWGPVLFALALAAILAPAAQAGSFHFNGATFGLGGSLVFSGLLSALDSEVAFVTLTGYGTVTAQCQNKAGNLAPGRNPISVSVQQTGEFTANENRAIQIEIHVPDPTDAGFEPLPTPKQAGCPNGKWSVVGLQDGSMNWTGLTLLIKDEFGQVQVDLDFTCNTIFVNGVGNRVACQES
jgi:hypothetical protein